MLPSPRPQLDTSAVSTPGAHGHCLPGGEGLGRGREKVRGRGYAGGGGGSAFKEEPGLQDPREQWLGGAEGWTPGQEGPEWQQGGWPGPGGLTGVWKRQGLQAGREEQSWQGKYKTGSQTSRRPAGFVPARSVKVFPINAETETQPGVFFCKWLCLVPHAALALAVTLLRAATAHRPGSPARTSAMQGGVGGTIIRCGAPTCRW